MGLVTKDNRKIKITPDTVITASNEMTYISLVTAKLAMEAGYNTFCQASWTEFFKTTKYYKKGQIQFDASGGLNGSNKQHNEMNTDYYKTYAAPTQEMLKYWLRTVHNVEVEVIRNLSITTIYSWCVFCSDLNNKQFNPETSSANSYEKAFEQSLKYAVEQIIIQNEESNRSNNNPGNNT